MRLTDAGDEIRLGFVRGLCDMPPACERKKPERRVPENVGASEEMAGKKEMAAKIKACDELTRSVTKDKENLFMASKAIDKLIGELETAKKRLLERSEREMLDLVLLVVGKVIHKKVDEDRDIIVSVLRDAIKGIREKEGARVRLNPEDYRYITEVNPDFLSACEDIALERDEEIGRGGAVIETRSGTVDARLDGQLDKVRESLYDRHGF